MKKQRIFFSVGEPSGDLHASNLIHDLRQIATAQSSNQGATGQLAADPSSFEFLGFGGPRMQNAGCELLEDMTQHAVMFLNGVFSKITKFQRLLKMADRRFSQKDINLVVLIDYSGFNWHVARLAKKHNIPVVFYGIPQMWAWAAWRIRKMQRNVDLGICKLPFEADWLKKRYCDAEYVGHPFFDEMERQHLDEDYVKQQLNGDGFLSNGSDLITILPGSRVQEIKNSLPTFLRTAKIISEQRPGTSFAVSCLNSDHAEMAQSIASEIDLPDNLTIESGKTPELIHLAKCCLACSGSVSLELMYREKPTVIFYKLGKIAYALQRFMLKIRYITLVNLLWSGSIEKSGIQVFDPDKPDAAPVPFPEYLSTKDESSSISKQLIRLLNDRQHFEAKVEQLRDLKARYGHAGASKRAASLLVDRYLTTEIPGSESSAPDVPQQNEATAKNSAQKKLVA